jgi:cephalosporin-C deacetylase-like acetyl esterase
MMRYSLLLLPFAIPAFADDATDKLAKELRDYATAELAKVPGKDGKYSTALPDYLREQIKQANQRDREAWNAVKTKEDWETFRDERIKALRESLGTWPEVPRFMQMKTTKTIEGDGYRIDNVLYESRPDVWVAGNMYYPATPQAAKRPIIMIAHAHHAPKHQSELQDMGVLWAKAGCLVLIIDQLGHGERRQHGFKTAKDYPKEYRVSRQDYFFRYNLNLQLSLVGDSLMGWMAWDLMRGLDVALAQPGADKDRVILMGAVAGGGDPAAVTAALDKRFTCVVPFNFGGPQPEHRYPLPEDAETSFNYAGSGSWESTRNLRDSAAKGFLPWVIVASVAPRKVIHAHEFSWDRERDPVWKRYQRVFGFYDAIDNLSFTTGGGVIHNNDPNGTHCTNIGAVHRKGIYAALKKWYDIPPPEKEPNERRTADELRCWTPEAIAELKPKPLHEVLGKMATSQSRVDRAKLRSASLRAYGVPKSAFEVRKFADDPLAKRLPMSCDGELDQVFFRGGTCRFWTLVPKKAERSRSPVVLCLAQEGGDRFIRERANAIANLIDAGVAVVITEWSGSGISRPDNGRSRTSYSSALMASSLMTDDVLPGLRLEFASYVMYQRLDPFDLNRAVLWGESFAKPLKDDQVSVPYDLSQPSNCEPFAAASVSILAVPKIKAILARGGLVSYRSVLDSPFIHVPHDALPINVFRAGDLPDVWAALAPKPLRLEGLVDGTNRRVTGEKLEKALKPVSEAYKKGGLVVKEDYSSDEEIAKWIIEQLKK